MTIAEQIKTASLAARREKAPHAVFLVTLLDAIQKIGKNAGNRETTDDEAIKVLKTFVDNAKATKEALLGRNAAENTSAQDLEIQIATQYIPTQLTAEEVEAQVRKALEGQEKPYQPKHMGLVMKHMNASYKGLFDGNSVKGIFEKISKE